MAEPDPAVLAAHAHSIRHRREIEASDICGCFYCLSTYAPSAIVRWVDGGETACCPQCGIDSVLGSASGYPIDRDVLERMKTHWFAPAAGPSR